MAFNLKRMVKAIFYMLKFQFIWPEALLPLSTSPVCQQVPYCTLSRAKIRELLQLSNVSSMENIQNLFKETIAGFMEDGLDAELSEELGYSKYGYKNKDTDNSRNGYSSKNLCTSFGKADISVPRDRKGEFEPQVLKKNQTSISQDIEEKIPSMYAKGMTTGDIEPHIRDIYGLEVSDTAVSRIMDKILPVANGERLRGGISGCHSLPCTQRRTGSEEGGLYHHWNQPGWPERRAGDVGWRERERQVLGHYPEQPEKPRCGGHLHYLHR